MGISTGYNPHKMGNQPYKYGPWLHIHLHLDFAEDDEFSMEFPMSHCLNHQTWGTY